MKKASELKTKMKITMKDFDYKPNQNDMQNYDNLILDFLNAKTPKEVFERVAEMNNVLRKWKQLSEDSDMKPEDECCELYAWTKEVLHKIDNRI